MSIHPTLRVRFLSLLVGGLALGLVFTIPFAAQKKPAGNPQAPPMLSPDLPAGALDERLIPLPTPASTTGRSRRATASAPQLTEDQKILHLLNRAGFGPRPGDIERVRRIGIEQYINEQLHPEDLSDDFLSRPLLAFSTLQMSQFDIFQTFDPQNVRPQPTPTPTPTPTPAPAPALATIPMPDPNGEPQKVEMTQPGGSIQQSTRRLAQQTATPQQMAPQQPGELQPPKGGTTDASMAPQPAGPQPPKGGTTNESMTQQPPKGGTTNVSKQQAAAKPPARNGWQPTNELQLAKLLRAMYSEKQLQEVMVDFWFNHFNVYAPKEIERWLLTSYERDVIRPHALGKFKDLLTAVAQSPAMLFYLDNFLSQMERPAPPPKFDADGNPIPQPRRPGLNENYARELMELHTLGVDGGYTQKDVIELARCLTGWTMGPRGAMFFTFRPRTHDRGEKIFLGTRIAPGGGIEDGLRALDILSRHPSTAKFISRKLCQRFVADEPPAALVDRAAARFTETGGDIREVVRAILTSPEFFSPKYYRNKIKSPLDLVASTVRATGASTNAFALMGVVARLGEPLYQCVPPTGYNENSSGWLSSATILERMNFAIAFSSNRINGTRVDLSRFAPPGIMDDQERFIDRLLGALVHSDVSADTRENLARVLSETLAKTTPAKYDKRARQKNNEIASTIMALILGSREFQVK